MPFTETFLCTPLPEGITGTKVRIAVLVSPRLGGDAADDLDNWPDVRDWPEIRPTWQVTIKQGDTEAVLTGTEVVPAAGYDDATWEQLFPQSMQVTPYVPVDRSEAPIYSYPVAKVVEFVRELHTKVLTSSRTQFPTLAQLQDDEVFQELKAALDPVNLGELQSLWSDGPKPDTDDAFTAFAPLEFIYGSRPGSAPPPVPTDPPVVTNVDPDTGVVSGRTPVTITGENFFEPVTVTFGSNLATEVVVVDEETITCRSPRAGFLDVEVDVRVTTNVGRSATSPDAKFTYYVPGPR
ncbi:IPT/TIG domain-containing protein [Catellatospora citrea]|uniref:IPT/TIG domain-containing protein n=1 Tax=Catellatospora citrea TaxID=53366 RepID=UPI0033E9A37B